MSQINFEDETLDASDGVTRLLLAAEYWKEKATTLRAELDALNAPEGWALVPIVSTQEMDEAGSTHCDGYLSIAQAVWDSMLAAAPKPEAKP